MTKQNKNYTNSIKEYSYIISKISSILLISLIAISLSAFSFGKKKTEKRNSSQVKIDKPAPEFTAIDVNGEEQSLSKYKGEIIVLEWFNPGCPFIKKHYEKSHNIPNLQKKYVKKGIKWLSINSTRKNHKDYLQKEELIIKQKENKSTPTSTIIDQKGKIGKLYNATTTPHFFIINKNGNLVYRGAIDSIASADPQDIKNAENYISKALDELLANKEVSTKITKSYGCSVKY